MQSLNSVDSNGDVGTLIIIIYSEHEFITFLNSKDQ